MLRKLLISTGAALLATALLTGSVAAQTVTASGGDSVYENGNFVSYGETTPNIFVGRSSGSGSNRAYVEFSVPASATPYTSATLRLGAGTDYNGPNTLEVFDVASDPAAQDGVAAYADLGTGVSFGTVTYNPVVTVITLNAQGLAAVNAARGSTIYFGLVNATIDMSVTDDLFSAGSQDTGPRELVLDVAPPQPEPIPTMSEWAIILLGLTMAGGAALYIQRRRLEA